MKGIIVDSLKHLQLSLKGHDNTFIFRQDVVPQECLVIYEFMKLFLLQLSLKSVFVKYFPINVSY